MNKTQKLSLQTVLVTGVGAIIGQGIVKSLRKARNPIRILGVDRNANAMGQYFCDDFYAKPDHDEFSNAYLDFWRNLLVKESVDLILPGLEVDLFFFNCNRKHFDKSGVKLGLNNSELIELAKDKWLFGMELPKAGLSSIPTVLSQNWQECIDSLGTPPFIMKPRHGNGSRGIVRLFNEGDFKYWITKTTTSFLVQKIIGNDEEEYTVGAFGLGNGDSLNPIIFRRKLSQEGNTQYAEVVLDSDIDKAVQKLSAYFKPIGPTNYQFRKEEGNPYLLEINPRLSSSTSLRAGFGYNEALMALDFYINKIRPETPKIIKGRAWRYPEDFFQK